MSTQSRRFPRWPLLGFLIAASLLPVGGGIYVAAELILDGDWKLDFHSDRVDPPPLFLHVVGSAVYYALAVIQVWPPLRKRFPVWHRQAGRVAFVGGADSHLAHDRPLPGPRRHSLLRTHRVWAALGAFSRACDPRNSSPRYRGAPGLVDTSLRGCDASGNAHLRVCAHRADLRAGLGHSGRGDPILCMDSASCDRRNHPASKSVSCRCDSLEGGSNERLHQRTKTARRSSRYSVGNIASHNFLIVLHPVTCNSWCGYPITLR